MLKHWKRTLALLSIAAAVALVSAGLALGKKPPKPPPEPPPPQPQPTVTYSITFLPSLPGQTVVYVHDLNNHGEVVGSSRHEGGLRPFLYTPAGGVVDLNDLISEEDKACWVLWSACGINDAGQIVGRGYLNGQSRAYRFTPAVDGAPAVVENLGTLGGDSVGRCINDGGEVAGYYFDADGSWHTHAFLYTDADGDGTEEMIDIGGLGAGAKTYPTGINSFGQVTGVSQTVDGGHPRDERAFRYTPGVAGLPGVMENLTPLLEWSGGNDIDENGHVVGYTGTGHKYRGWFVHHAFLYTDDNGLIDLGTLGGYKSSATGINSSGEIVGVSKDGTTKDGVAQPVHGFLYTNKTDQVTPSGDPAFAMFKLEDRNLIENLPADFQGYIEPQRINDSGQICGKVVVEGSAPNEAVLLTPVEP